MSNERTNRFTSKVHLIGGDVSFADFERNLPQVVVLKVHRVVLHNEAY